MNRKAVRQELHKKNPYCHWCERLTVEGGTDALAATLYTLYPTGHPWHTKHSRRRAGGFQRGSPLYVVACVECSRTRAGDGGEGPTGCMDDGDALGLAMRGITQQDLNRVLNQTLNVPTRRFAGTAAQDGVEE